MSGCKSSTGSCVNAGACNAADRCAYDDTPVTPKRQAAKKAVKTVKATKPKDTGAVVLTVVNLYKAYNTDSDGRDVGAIGYFSTENALSANPTSASKLIGNDTT